MYGSIKIAQKLAMMNKLFLLLAVASSIMTAGLAGTSTTTKRPTGKNNSGVTPADQCGVWVKEPEGGQFTSPNYPQRYPPERECTYIIEAAPRQCIDLFFDDGYSIEPSWDCKFDHIEVRDGPFSFSPIIGRYCGQQSPAYVRSSGRYLYVKFVADGELEAMGFSARYNFTKDPEFIDKGELPPLPFCDFEMGGPEGIAESIAVTLQNRALPTEAVDCRWYIRAPPGHKINLRFLEYEMHNSNECKRNFVAIYDGSSSVEHLKNKYCSTVANDLMLTSSVGVIRLWADEGSRRSRFRILYTTFHEPPCEGDTFFCHSNMCINNTLVCNGIQNCVFPWDENHCKEKRKSSILDNLDHTNVTIIAVTCGLVVILLIISCIIQIKQPRKKYIIRREDFDPTLLHPAFDPPHYELCTLRRSTSADDIADDFDKFQKLRRSSSRCIRDHHCGSQQGSVHGSMHGSMHGSVHGSRSNLSMRDATCLSDSVAGGSGPPPPPPPPPPLLPPPQQQLFLPQLSPHAQHGILQGRRSVLVMKHSYSQDGGLEGAFCDQDDEDDMMMDEGPTTSHHPHHHLPPHPLHQSMLGLEQNTHHSMSNDFYY